ncbi:zinc metalloprotease HtpX [Candidatus Woesearchaeota archaeon]|nr:zinc metalloprotease HtpX [Candidatus Woesearchaeota archaeon]
MIKNQLKTVLFLGILTGLLLLVGSFFGKTGLTIAIIFVCLMNFVTYWFSDKIVLFMYGAKEIEKKGKIYELVKEVAKDTGVPIPRIFMINQQYANAFATGRDPKHASIAFTKGILDFLSDEELKGVIAHEMAHVKNRDILISTIAATIAGVISYAAMMARYAAIFGMGGRDRDNNIMGMIIMAIVAPIIAMFIQLAISRSREYLADETGARNIKNPKALASALKKLTDAVEVHPIKNKNTATAHMFIVNPFTAKGFFTLLSTHPPLDERVKRLNEMKI